MNESQMNWAMEHDWAVESFLIEPDCYCVITNTGEWFDSLKELRAWAGY